MATWRQLLTERMQENGETPADLISNTLTDVQMDVEFYDGNGTSQGQPFTAWSEKHVYFPVCYDGAEWVGSVSRHPDGQPTRHQGGE